MLDVFFGVVERAAPVADEAVGNAIFLAVFEAHRWPEAVERIWGPATRERVLGWPPATPSELLAGELTGVALEGVELRAFDEEDLDGHHDHDERDHHPPSEGEALPPGLAADLRAALREPLDGQRLGALLRLAAADLPSGHALAPPPEVDLEARWRVRGAIARYLDRTAY
jgi:hypothetical protein